MKNENEKNEKLKLGGGILYQMPLITRTGFI